MVSIDRNQDNVCECCLLPFSSNHETCSVDRDKKKVHPESLANDSFTFFDFLLIGHLF